MGKCPKKQNLLPMNASPPTTNTPSRWRAQLDLRYQRDLNRTTVKHTHNGPLRTLKSLYPEGDGICHNVLVHPPSGLVGGDAIDVQVDVGVGAHALVTTPGATRFYRSEAGLASQQVAARVASGARLEWLPLEAIAYDGCDALNDARFELAEGAEMMAWDITALGLPNANLPFKTGQFQQHMAINGHWLERGLIRANDDRLLNGPLGLDGMRCMGTLVFGSGLPLEPARVSDALAVCRATLEAHPLRVSAGATSPNRHVVVVRVLSPLVEDNIALLRAVWANWRKALWALPNNVPRMWNM